MSFWEFVDKNLLFSGVTILLVLGTIDNMWANWCKSRSDTKK